MRSFRSRRRRRIWLLAVVAACGLSMLFGGCADRLLLYPSNQPLNYPGESSLAVSVPSGIVDVWTARSAPGTTQPEAYVLNFTGNASRGEFEAEIVADEWAGHSVEVWSVNYPGYGRSTGPAKMKSIRRLRWRSTMRLPRTRDRGRSISAGAAWEPPSHSMWRRIGRRPACSCRIRRPFSG